MPVRNSSRRARLKGRSRGNRPRTRPSSQPPSGARKAHPSPKARHRPAASPAATAEPPPTFASAKDLRNRLDLVHDVVITVAIALENEKAEHGLDFASVLTRCAADPLWGIIIEQFGDDDEGDL